MNKLILPINAYIVNSNGSIVDAFSGAPSYGNENGADVYHVYNADDNAYYNVLMTEELKAVIATAFNAPYVEGSYTGGGTRVLTVGSADPKTFEWQPINSLVLSPRIQGIYLNDKYLMPGQHGYSTVNGHSQSVLVYAKEPNFLYVTAPSGAAAYISLKSEGSGNGSVYYTEDPYSNNWNSLNYNASLNVAGKKYYLSGDVNPYVGTNTSNYIHFVTSGASTISFYGDITYLVGNNGLSNYSEPAYKGGDKVLKKYQFYRLFYNCAQMIKAPDLPSTTLANSCYAGMFYNCTSLTTAPELPATTLASDCYNSMFSNCTHLTKAPKLPATTLATHCYNSMFISCTSLTTAPDLPATALANSCYNSMFYNCNGLTTAPDLPATALADSCYSYMFYYCTSLTTAPELPATTLVQNCYNKMFSFCNNLNYVKALFTTTPSTSYTADWLYGVASTGTFVKSKNATWTDVGTYAVPVGWTASVYKTEQLHTDELPESYIEDTGKVLTVDASGLWVKKKIDIGSQIEYDSSNKVITLKDASGNTLGTPIDATDFIKDGMVNDVSIHDGNMVISFNTDSGKEDISIPLSRIFDSSNYYTKSESDAKYVWDSSSPWEQGTGTGSAQLKGAGADASGNYSVAQGVDTIASGDYSHAEGDSVTASGGYSHAEGDTTKAFGNYSHAEGASTSAIGIGSHAEGAADSASFKKLYISGSANSKIYKTKNNGSHGLKKSDIIKYENIYATVISINNSYTFTASHTLDASNPLVDAEILVCKGIAYGSYSHTEGYMTTASGMRSHAEGHTTKASGESSHAEGANTIASGDFSHAEGYAANASKVASHAEGIYATASGDYSHAEGSYTAASGVYSHAEGGSTIASGDYSHVEGFATRAPGIGSHAEGSNTTASSNYSHAEGYNTTTSNEYEHAQGILNISHNDTLFSIGNGVNSSDGFIEANALEIMRNGDAYLYGVASFDGQTIGSRKTLQYYLDTNLISEQEYDYIFNTSSTALNPQLLHLYIDDYPDEKLSGMMSEVGVETVYDFYDIVYDANVNNGQYSSEAVHANEFIYVDTVIIDNTDYYLWHCINNSDSGDQLYAIMRTDMTLEDLDAMAKCNNPNSNVSPFIAIVTEDLEVRYDDTTSNNVNANYQLACYKIDEE